MGYFVFATADRDDCLANKSEYSHISRSALEA
jgi:hypothetical protein